MQHKCQIPSKRRTDEKTDTRPQRTNDVHYDRRRHAVSTSLRLVDRVKTQMDEQTDRCREENCCILCDTWWK